MHNPLQLPLRKGERTTALILAFVLMIIGTLFLWYSNRPCANFNQATIKAPIQIINLALANTPEQQAKGLGGCKEVPKNSGMYFVFDAQEERTFWMKDMIIPIDIIWIKEGKVVGIEKNVPSLPLDTPDSDLPKYTSPEAVDSVLEVEAGMAEVYGIEVGLPLNIDNKQPVRDTSPIL